MYFQDRLFNVFQPNTQQNYSFIESYYKLWGKIRRYGGQQVGCGIFIILDAISSFNFKYLIGFIYGFEVRGIVLRWLSGYSQRIPPKTSIRS